MSGVPLRGLSGVPLLAKSGVPLMRPFNMGDRGLIVAGPFTLAGGYTANKIASWDGTDWGSLGSGPGGSLFNPHVRFLIPYNGKLLVFGTFTMFNGVPAHGAISWDGTSWEPLGTAFSTGGAAYTAFVHSGKLYVAGSFTSVGGVATRNFATWDGSDWEAFGNHTSINLSGVPAACIHDGKVYASGSFISTVYPERIAWWDGSQWVRIPNGPNSSAMISFGGKLIAGGSMAYGVYSWDGSNWEIMGDGFGPQGNSVTCFHVYNGQLIAGGAFVNSGSTTVNGIAAWDGSNWTSMGGGVGGQSSFNVQAMTTFRGLLIAGGAFITAGGQPASRIAAWDGSNWSSLGTGVNSSVNALGVFS